MAQRNRTKLAVLGFLTWKPMSGYEIKKAIEGIISNFWKESYGQLYPILNELAEEGLATRESQETEGGRTQHIYAITPTGRAALRDWLTEPPRHETLRNELLLKLFFGAQIGVETSLGHVEESRRGTLATIAAYEGIEREIASRYAGMPDAAYWLMTLRYGLAVHRAVLGWTEETLAELKEMQAGRSRRSHPLAPERATKSPTTPRHRAAARPARR